MSAGIVAKFPWPSVYLPGLDEPPFAIIISDTRVAGYANGIVGVFKELAPKQFKLAQNLVACYTSNNLYATASALYLKGREPSKRKTSLATWRDVRRLGEILRSSHERWGECSEMLAVILPRGHAGPSVYELMPPTYKPNEVEGIVGIGAPSVLTEFERLYEARPLGTFSGRSLYEPAAVALAAAFSEAVEKVGAPAVALPLQVTTIRREGIFSERLGIIRSGEEEMLTAIEGELVLPANPSRGRPYRAEPLHANRLQRGVIPSIEAEADLRVVLEHGGQHALAFAALLEPGALHFGTPRSGNTTGSYSILEQGGNTYNYGLLQMFSTEPGVPLGEIGEPKKISQVSPNLGALGPTYTPLQDSSRRRSLNLTLPLSVPSFTIDVWLGSTDGTDLRRDMLSSYSSSGVQVLGEIVADWSRPQFALVVWSLTSSGWASLESAMSSQHDV